MTKRAKVQRIDGDKSERPYVVHTPNDEVIRITVRQAQVLSDRNAPGYAATLDEVKQVDREAASKSEGIYFKTLPFPRSSELTDWIYRVAGRYLSSRIGVAVASLVGVVGLIAFLVDGDLNTLHHASADNAAASLVAVIVWTGVLGVLHELGHAMALIRYGQPVRAVGLCFYFGAPTFYTDSTLALLLNKRQRIIQSGAGVWTDFVVAGLVMTLVVFLDLQGTFRAVAINTAIFTYYQGWLSLAPLMKLDGYWMLSDAVGRPQLLSDSLRALRRNWRSRLGLYGLMNLAGAVTLLVATVVFWTGAFRNVLSPAWHQGAAAKVAVVVFLFVLGYGLIGGLVSAFRDQRRRRHEDSQFESENDDRVRAAEAWDELAWQPEFTEEELGVVAGAFEIFRLEAGEPLTTAGEVPSGVYVLLGASPEVIGLESVFEVPSSSTVVSEADQLCAFLTANQARMFIGKRRLGPAG